jgi:hypothetical protein
MSAPGTDREGDFAGLLTCGSAKARAKSKRE